MKYTNGSITVEAERHTGSYPKARALCKRYSDLFPVGGFWGKWNGKLWLFHPDGQDTVEVGDWIVALPEGGIRRWEHEAFTKAFKAVE